MHKTVRTSEYSKKKHRSRSWQQFVRVMACVVVFCTTYALILPALTLEVQDVCLEEEHTHEDKCYQQVTSRQVTKLSCGFSAPDGVTVVHEHDDYCYLDGELVCTLPEVEAHTHTDNCYELVYPEDGENEKELTCKLSTDPHSHDDSCYTTYEEPQCGLPEHIHGETCQERVLSCPYHEHTDECYDGEALVCEYPEENHIHNEDACYKVTSNCEMKEHKHTDSCYKVLTCELDTTAPAHVHTDPQCYSQGKGHKGGAEESAEPQRILRCTKTEIIPHQHKGTCYEIRKDENGAEQKVLVCTQPEILTHQHTADCFTTANEPVDTETLTCTLPEDENHTHNQRCYGTWELFCEKKEHTHTEKCRVLTDAEKASVQAAEEAIASLPEADAVTAQFDTLTQARDLTGWEAAKQDLEQQLQQAQAAVDALPQDIRSAVSSLEKLESLQTFLSSLTPPALTEAETPAVTALDEKLADLPAIEDIRERLEEAEDDDDEDEDDEDDESRADVLAELTALAKSLRAEYDALNDVQQRSLTNTEKLTALEALLAKENSKLTEEERAQVEEVEFLISVLPDLDETRKELDELEGENRETRIQKLFSATRMAKTAYDALSDKQKDAVDPKAVEKLNGYIELMKELGLIQENQHTVKQYTDASCTTELVTNVSVSLTGDLPEGAEVRSYPVDFSMGEDGPTLFAQDITIYLADGSEYKLKEPVTVSVSGLNIPEHGELDVFHDLEDEYGGMERMAYTIDGDTVTFQATSFSMYAIIDAYKLNRIAEAAENPGVIDDAWINYWSDKLNSEPVTFSGMDASALAVEGGNGEPSDEQVTERGGSKTDDTVTVSKTIQGTDVENVFDITLKVDTTTNITEIMQEPDMAVVIVMDISNTMNSGFGGKTRYEAAVESAEAFMDKFAANNKGYSKLGYVAFNTHAHEIFGLSKCTTNEVTNLKNTLRTKTGNIINHYAQDSTDRFTNVEAGLKRASDMLKDAPNKNKYIIFLSDGFPTTYISSGYNGYNPYTSSGTPGADGTFYDFVDSKYCKYGTSYSDKAAIRAREMATSIKNSGTTIYSIGIDVGGQSIAQYDTHRNDTGSDRFSVIDRTSENYEIGSADSKEAYKNWLGNSIGSGYYYDSTDTEGLKAAYDAIFEQIKSTTEQANNLKWIASDPMPMGMQNNEVTMEFIGFFDKNNALQVYPPQTGLTGKGEENAENTASFNAEKSTISWDIKNSGYTTTVSDSSTTYHYTVTYRVRLKNELEGFVENQSYQTNGKTTLTYQEVTVVDGKETISGDKTIDFPIPAVKGYLGELTFKKVDEKDNNIALAGAEFTLTHDTTTCDVCRGDNKASVSVNTATAVSDENGIVTFEKIPSGHTYTLVETKYPAGYFPDGKTYSVNVAYDVVKVTEKDSDGKTTIWNLSNDNPPNLTNRPGVELPNTGGIGTHLYMFGGVLLVTIAGVLLMYNPKRRKGAGPRA